MALSLRAMRYVQAALRCGNISNAAEQMNVAPSAVASALGQAEKAFGMALVTRARAKGVFLTAAGRRALHRIDDLLERHDAMLADLSDLQSGVSGNLAIGYNAPIAPAFLPAIISEMRAPHPHVAFSFAEGDNASVRSGLLNGRFDVILFVEELPDPRIETCPLIYAPTYFLCSEDHPLADMAAVSVRQIAKEPLILLDRPAARGYYMDLLESSGENLNIVATANSTEMVRSLVAEKVGVSLLNMRPRDVSPYSGGSVCSLPISGANSGVTLSLGYAPGPRRRLVQMFVDRCSDYFSGPEGQDVILTDH